MKSWLKKLYFTDRCDEEELLRRKLYQKNSAMIGKWQQIINEAWMADIKAAYEDSKLQNI